MKEDILEQIIDDWLLSQEGIFTKHNVKYRPDKKSNDYDSKTDSSFSDIDILSYNTREESYERVCVVNCKSWQHGFDIKYFLENLTVNPNTKYGNKEIWKFFRELVVPKWTKAFVDKIKDETNSSSFTYMIACTKFKGSEEKIKLAKKEFVSNDIFHNNFKNAGADVKIIIKSFDEIFDDYFKKIDKSNLHTLEATEVGRLLQLIKASGVFSKKNKDNENK